MVGCLNDVGCHVTYRLREFVGFCKTLFSYSGLSPALTPLVRLMSVRQGKETITLKKDRQSTINLFYFNNGDVQGKKKGKKGKTVKKGKTGEKWEKMEKREPRHHALFEGNRRQEESNQRRKKSEKKRMIPSMCYCTPTLLTLIEHWDTHIESQATTPKYTQIPPRTPTHWLNLTLSSAAINKPVVHYVLLQELIGWTLISKRLGYCSSASVILHRCKSLCVPLMTVSYAILANIQYPWCGTSSEKSNDGMCVSARICIHKRQPCRHKSFPSFS